MVEGRSVPRAGVGSLPPGSIAAFASPATAAAPATATPVKNLRRSTLLDPFFFMDVLLPLCRCCPIGAREKQGGQIVNSDARNQRLTAYQRRAQSAISIRREAAWPTDVPLV